MLLQISVCLVCVHFYALCHATCETGYFISGYMCLPCPPNCVLCLSGTNCTQCSRGYFGDLCNNSCPEKCSGGCQRQYGHCTYGCIDKYFALDNRKECAPCPKNCGLCSSASNCSTCRDGFYGRSCSEMCPSECENGACNKSTGYCLKCKEGYYMEGGKCLSCRRECFKCNNSANCTECHKTYAGPFEGHCIRKCSANSTSVFFSNSTQRCGTSLDNVRPNQLTCLTSRITKKYACRFLRHCIDCDTPANGCNSRTNDSHMCLGYEQCITECKPQIPRQVVETEGMTDSNALCEQTCSTYHSRDSKRDDVCPLTTDEIIGNADKILHFVCLQDPDMTVNISADNPSPVAVFVLVVAVVSIILMIVILVYLYKRLAHNDGKSFAKIIGLTPDVVQEASTSTTTIRDHVNTGLYLSPTPNTGQFNLCPYHSPKPCHGLINTDHYLSPTTNPGHVNTGLYVSPTTNADNISTNLYHSPTTDPGQVNTILYHSTTTNPDNVYMDLYHSTTTHPGHVNTDLYHTPTTNPDTVNTDLYHSTTTNPDTVNTDLYHSTTTNPDTVNTDLYHSTTTNPDTVNTDLYHSTTTSPDNVNTDLYHSTTTNPDNVNTDLYHSKMTNPDNVNTDFYHSTMTNRDKVNTDQ